MATFVYDARNKQGERFAGEVEARTIHEAARLIRRKGLWIASLRACEGKPADGFMRRAISLGRASLMRGVMGREETILFLRQMTVLLQTGMPVHQALQALAEEGGKKAYTRLVKAMMADLMNGSALADAMEKHPRVFPPSVSSLVRAGEASGTLEQVVGSLADFLERDYRAREKLKTVMMYPLALLAASLLSMGLMTVFVLPTLALLLQNLHAELPLPTRALLFFAEAVQHHLMLIVLVLLLGILLLVFLYRQPVVRERLDHAILFVPFFGPLRIYSEWRGALETLAVLMRNGIVLNRALEMVAPAAGNHWIRRILERARERVLRGSAFCSALQGDPVFPAMLAALLAAGERSGELERMLEKAAEFCIVTTENRSARIQAMAEPVLIFIVGGVIFFFVLAIILPLLETMDALS